MRLVYFTDRDLGLIFPLTLRAAGLRVEAHRDHFPPTAPDDEWLATVAAREWVTLTHDARMRYKPNELAAIVRHRARVLVVVGKTPLAALADSFVRTSDRIEAFLAKHDAPVVAKVYRASPQDLARDENAPGRIERWYPVPS